MHDGNPTTAERRLISPDCHDQPRPSSPARYFSKFEGEQDVDRAGWGRCTGMRGQGRICNRLAGEYALFRTPDVAPLSWSRLAPLGKYPYIHLRYHLDPCLRRDSWNGRWHRQRRGRSHDRSSTPTPRPPGARSAYQHRHPPPHVQHRFSTRRCCTTLRMHGVTVPVRTSCLAHACVSRTTRTTRTRTHYLLPSCLFP